MPQARVEVQELRALDPERIGQEIALRIKESEVILQGIFATLEELKDNETRLDSIYLTAALAFSTVLSQQYAIQEEMPESARDTIFRYKAGLSRTLRSDPNILAIIEASEQLKGEKQSIEEADQQLRWQVLKPKGEQLKNSWLSIIGSFSERNGHYLKKEGLNNLLTLMRSYDERVAKEAVSFIDKAFVKNIFDGINKITGSWWLPASGSFRSGRGILDNGYSVSPRRNSVINLEKLEEKGFYLEPENKRFMEYLNEKLNQPELRVNSREPRIFSPD